MLKNRIPEHGEPLNHSITSTPSASVEASTVSGDSFGRDQNGVPIGKIIAQSDENVNTNPAAQEQIDLTSAFEPDMNRAIQKQNKLQSLGGQLENIAEAQKYSALYDSLNRLRIVLKNRIIKPRIITTDP